MFFKGSRYEKVPDAVHTGPDGRAVRYKRVRFTPDAPAATTHRVESGERPDHVAHAHYHDPERYWRLCDANLVLRPAELTAEPGRRILVPPSEG